MSLLFGRTRLAASDASWELLDFFTYQPWHSEWGWIDFRDCSAGLAEFSCGGLQVALHQEALFQRRLVLCHASADGWYSLGEVSWKTKIPGGCHGKALSGDVDGVGTRRF